MKKAYIAPALTTYELSTEDGLLTTISNGQTTTGFGTSTQSGVKQFNGDIEFDDMKGTDIVRRNPWDSQW